jgi:hypothetical protein
MTDDLDERIAHARRHVQDGRRIVERQRIRVAEGHAAEALQLLRLFEQTQVIFEADLARLLDQRIQADAPISSPSSARR